MRPTFSSFRNNPLTSAAQNKSNSKATTENQKTKKQNFIESIRKNVSRADDGASKYFEAYTDEHFIEMHRPLEKCSTYDYEGGSYTGEWDEEQQCPQGFGALTIKNGKYNLIYEGIWDKGKVTLPNGKTYTGPKWEKWEISSYEGDIKNNKAHGKGKYTLSNRDKYEGQLENNKRHGEGRFTWTSGNYYTGSWENNKRHGTGIFYNKATGQKKEQTWKNGILIKEEVISS